MTSNIYTCPSCGQDVPVGRSHICSPASGVSNNSYNYSPVSAEERMSVALERIATVLERWDKRGLPRKRK